MTSSFFLGYNNIRDITGLASSVDAVMADSFRNLQWLDLQHNFIVELTEDIAKFPKLKMLYLHCNYIFDLKEFVKLKPLTQLKALTVHGNPIVRLPNFRLHLIDLFPELKKLDTVLVTKDERDAANVWVNTFNVKELPAYVLDDCPKPPKVENPDKENDD